MGNRPAPVPRERNLAEPFTRRNQEGTLVGLHWSHAFSEQWVLRHRFNFENDEADQTGVFFGPPAADGTVDRGFFTDPDLFGRRYFTSVDLTGKFELGGLRHTLLLGGDYFRQDAGFTQIGSRSFPINIFRPAHTGEPPPTDPSSAEKADETLSWYGLYFQDQIELPYNLFALAGFRYDNAEISDNLLDLTTAEDDRVSPRGALLWRPIPALSLYGSYTENFGASNGFAEDDETPLPPETAQQWELGVKTELADGRLTATLAYFDLTKQNILVPDPANPALFSRAIGEAESRGVELDVAGEILPGWRVIGGYAYTPFAEVTKDVGSDGGPGSTGTRFFAVPRHAGSLFSTYEFLGGDFKGLTLGGGVVAAGQREAQVFEPFYQLPGYAVVNLFGSYSWKVGPTKLTAYLNVDNLLDKTYFESSNGANQTFFGTPRTFLGSIRVEF